MRQQDLDRMNQAFLISPSLRTSRLDADIEDFLRDINGHLQPQFQKAISRVSTAASLKDGILYQIDGGGKRIRAALCALVCEIFCASYQPALSFAAAIEHLQNFTLIHDDIADGDLQRRGRDSTWKRFGLAHSVNIGDAFIPLSSLAILDADYPLQTKLHLFQILSEFGLEVAEGQSLDIDLRENNAPTVEDYIACTRKKTGAFFAMAVVGGAIIGGAYDKHLSSLKEFALQAGVAFQIKDDVLDYVGGKGRPTGGDILEGKRTLMVVYAHLAASEEERSNLFRILNKPGSLTDYGDVSWVHDLYRRTHAREQSEEMAENLIDRALDHLSELPNIAAKYRFLRLSKYLTHRIH